MKLQPQTQNYVVLAQEKGVSKITGHPYVKIIMVGTRDRMEYVTYIDHANHNHSNWYHIVNTPQNGFILSNLKIKTHKGKMLVDADSRPVIRAEDPEPDRILDTLREVWAEQDAKPTNLFRSHFE